MKKLFTLFSVFILVLAANAQDTTDCYLHTNFTYSTDGEYIYFTNTSTDEPVDATYSWWVSPLASALENPSFLISDLDDPTTACFSVYNDDWTCYDSICMLISFVEDTVVIIDSTDCYLNANFTYSTDGEYIYFTNTSTDEPVDATYSWWVSPLSSALENPSFLISDLDDPTTACLSVYNDDWTCYDSICMLISFVEDTVVIVDSTDCLLNVSYTSLASETTLFCTNTSTGEPASALYRWYLDGSLASTEENPSFDLGLFDESTWLCFEILDSSGLCYDSTCTVINSDSIDFDSTATIAAFELLHVNLYPNPATAILTVQLNRDGGASQLFIQNALGEIVLIEQIGAGNTTLTLDIANLPTGFYIVTVVNNDTGIETAPEKFIKK